MQRAWLSLLGAVVGLGCAPPVNLGTDVMWSTDFESGTLADWSSAPGTGGTYDWQNSGTVVVSTEQAHSGHYSAKMAIAANLPEPGATTPGGIGLYKEAQFPESSYYSSWYYLTRSYVTTSGWIILKFRGVVTSDAGEPTDLQELLALSLQSLPGGMTLTLTDARHQYLASPLPDPVPFVPIGQWFQIECLYRNSTGADGRITVWLDGTMIYDVVRPTGPNAWVYFSPCSLAYDLTPSNAVLYLDDVAIATERMTPRGILRVP